MLTEREMIQQFVAQEVVLPPLTGRVLSREHAIRQMHERVDALIRLEWRAKTYDFAAEFKAGYTPRILEQAMDQALRYSRNGQTYPMIVVPYLDEEALEKLETEGVSGLDLCGNGIVVVPNNLLVFRTGYPNRFPQNTPIKNVYRGSSSLVARACLLQPNFPSVGKIQDAIHARHGYVALSTVSKVLKALEEEIIIERCEGTIRLLQPEKLLDLLLKNYRPPQVTRRFRGRATTNDITLMEALYSNAAVNRVDFVMTGASSAERYVPIARSEAITFYCKNIEGLLAMRDGENPAPLVETSRFADVELIETQDETVYFDQQEQVFSQEFPDVLYSVASPIQAYLELATGDPREQQTAEQIKQILLGHINGA